MSKKSRAPRLKVRQPGKDFSDEDSEYVPVDDITFDDIFKPVDENNPALEALGIDRERVKGMNETIARIRKEYYDKFK